MVIIWVFFAPTQVGGMASYAIVAGSSMEPNFHIGDLVIAHKGSTYQVGDAVVYRNFELQGFVFHRIIAENMGLYILQGDNNSWTDTHQPSKEEVIGKLWFHIPRGGLAIQKIRNPWVMALIAAIVGLVFASSLFNNKLESSKHMNTKTFQEWFVSTKQKTQGWIAQIRGPETQTPSAPHPGGMLEGVFIALGLVLLFSLLIGIISFSRPTFRIAQHEAQYQHLGIFSYLASAPQGVYDSNTISSGDPIFPRLTCTVDVNLQYTLIAQQAANITGTYQLTAVIREQVSGWQRKLPLQEENAFTGTTFGTTAKLDLCAMEALTKSMEQTTETHSGSYILLVVPNVRVNGELAGQTVESRFDSGLTFLFDGLRFYLVQDEEAGNPLSFTEAETSNEERSEVNTMTFLGKQIPVPTLRWIALIGAIVSLSGLVFLGLKLQAISRIDQGQFLRLKYDSLMVDVQNLESPGSDDCVDVISMDALAKLAERFNAVILHQIQGHLHRYSVQAGGTTYRFEIGPNKTEADFPVVEPASQGGGS
jgi:signal peptidase I